MPPHRAIVYGPIPSRRLGRSLGLNLSPAGVKLCNFNCPYCQYGWTRAGSADVSGARWAAPASVERALVRWLHRHGPAVDRLTIAGQGEPTLHPRFGEVVDRMCTVRDRLAPGIPIAILSNSSTAADADVRRALSRLDERYMKLDAGDAAIFRRMNAAAVAFEQVLDGLRRLGAIVVQAMFVTGASGTCGNADARAVARWIEALRRIRPTAVQIYSLDRAPAWAALQPVAGEQLRAIARQVEEAGLVAHVFAPQAQGDEAGEAVVGAAR